MAKTGREKNTNGEEISVQNNSGDIVWNDNVWWSEYQNNHVVSRNSNFVPSIRNVLT